MSLRAPQPPAEFPAHLADQNLWPVVTDGPTAPPALQAPFARDAGSDGRTRSQHRRPFAGMRILVAEDGVMQALDLQAMLAALGADVVGPAMTVEEALLLLDQGATPDAAILDIRLAGSVITPVAAHLQALGVPFLLATGYGLEHPLRAEFPSAPVLAKPYTGHLVIEAMQALRPVPG